jgi:hypothetical protein
MSIYLEVAKRCSGKTTRLSTLSQDPSLQPSLAITTHIGTFMDGFYPDSDQVYVGYDGYRAKISQEIATKLEDNFYTIVILDEFTCHLRRAPLPWKKITHVTCQFEHDAHEFRKLAFPQQPMNADLAELIINAGIQQG